MLHCWALPILDLIYPEHMAGPQQRACCFLFIYFCFHIFNITSCRLPYFLVSPNLKIIARGANVFETSELKPYQCANKSAGSSSKQVCDPRNAFVEEEGVGSWRLPVPLGFWKSQTNIPSCQWNFPVGHSPPLRDRPKGNHSIPPITSADHPSSCPSQIPRVPISISHFLFPYTVYHIHLQIPCSLTPARLVLREPLFLSVQQPLLWTMGETVPALLSGCEE